MSNQTKNKLSLLELGPAVLTVGLLLVGRITGAMDTNLPSGRSFLAFTFSASTVLYLILYFLSGRESLLKRTPEKVRKKLLLGACGSVLVIVLAYLLPYYLKF